MYKAINVYHRQCGLKDTALWAGAIILVLPMFAFNFKQITYHFIVSKETLVPSTSKHDSEYRWKDMWVSKQISKYI